MPTLRGEGSAHSTSPPGSMEFITESLSFLSSVNGREKLLTYKVLYIEEYRSEDISLAADSLLAGKESRERG